MSLFCSMDSWLTHQWLPPGGRLLYINEKTITQHFCVACKRDFVEDIESGERYAVRALVVDFTRLADEVNARWLTEPCPGEPVPSDEQDRKTHHAPSAGTSEAGRSSSS